MKPSRKRGHFAIFERDHFRCVYCGASPSTDSEVSLTVDHIIPVNGGGSDRADNLVTCCESCNSQKQDRLIDRESQRKYQKLAIERNHAAGLADGLMIVLGKTSAERRSRLRWQSLMVRAFWTWEDFMMEAHEVNGNLGASHRAFEQSMALARVYMLAIHSLPDYTRLTGDANRSQEMSELLEQAAIELYVAAEVNLMQHYGQLKDNTTSLAHALEIARSKANSTFRMGMTEAVDANGVEYVKSGSSAVDLLKLIKSSLDEAESEVKLAGGEEAELRLLLSAVVQQFLADKLATKPIDREQA
jgi:HNH endonuclease